MYEGKVDVIVFGADRVAANGDVANKIGTYKVAVCGKENNIPVYACVPVSTIDLTIPTGKSIPIEVSVYRKIDQLLSRAEMPKR